MSWYVVYTQASKESLAALNLARQGFEAYLPRYRRRRRHARRVDSVLKPLFPRYLFVKMDPASQRWQSINGTMGVCHLLTDGNRPLPVPEKLISAIAEREHDGVVSIAPPNFSHGQRVQITEGPLANLEGLFECIDDADRVVLLLDFMGRKIEARLPALAVTTG